MKCLAGMLAALWVVAAQSQTPAPDQAPDQTSIADPTTAPQPAAAQSAAMASAEAVNANVGAPVQTVGSAAQSAEVAEAASYLRSAAADFTNCRRASACYAYFDSFGVAIPFADGSIVPFSHVQRLTLTSRECIKKAKVLEEEGDRSLAVQWAMAARIENRSVRDWLGNHPDAVLEALRQVIVP